MSTDYFLYSPSNKRCVMVGSVGLSGVKSWPTEYGGKDFLAWAIENSVTDIVLVTEHQLPDDDSIDNISQYHPDGYPPRPQKKAASSNG
jgi:hypothetical protein